MAVEGSRRRKWALRVAGGCCKDTALDQAGDRTSGSEVWFCQFLRATYLPSLSLSFSVFSSCPEWGFEELVGLIIRKIGIKACKFTNLLKIPE